MNEFAQRKSAVFDAAHQIQEPTARDAFVRDACRGDEAMIREIHKMLDAESEARRFLKTDDVAHDESDIAHAATLDELQDSIAEGPGSRIGPYKLLEKIGEGGFGVVYMAEQREPFVRRVALKIIKLGMETRQVIARFEAERQALAYMDHPHIASILGAGTTDSGRPYFCMELVQGLPITEFCDKERLSTEQRLRLFAKVCSAAHHAHQKGIIHRDIKPSNVLVSFNGDEPFPKIIDFGIAKATRGRLTEKTLFTQFQQFIGTPAYMSPEQARMSAFDIDTRSDIYSLGVLLYELVTGKPPFDTKELLSKGFDEICRCVREDEPPRPSTRLSTLKVEEARTVAQRRQTTPDRLGRSIRSELDWVILKAIEKDRARRYESAAAFEEDVHRYLRDEPVAAVKPSPLYLLGKFARKRRAAVAFTIALFVMALVSVAVSSQYAIDALRSRDKAQNSAAIAALNEQRAEDALHRMEVDQAELLIQNDQVAEGIARLVGVARHRPDDWAVSQRLISAFQNHWFVARLCPPIQLDKPFREARFTPNGNHLIVCSIEGALLYAVTEQGALKRSILSDTPTRHVIFSASGARFLTIHSDSTVRVWTTNGFEPIGRPLEHDFTVRAAAFSPDGSRIVTGGNGGGLRYWDVATNATLGSANWANREISEIYLDLTGERVLAFTNIFPTEYDPQGRPIVRAVPSDELRSQISCWSTPDLTFQWESEEGSGHGAVAASPLQDLVFVNNRDGGKVYNWTTGDIVDELIIDDGASLGARFTDDGRLIVLGNDHKGSELSVFDVEENSRLSEIDIGSSASNFDLSANGRVAITTSFDGELSVWNLERQTRVGSPRWMEGDVRFASLSSDGKRIVVGMRDGRLELLKSNDPSSTQEPIASIPVEQQRVSFSPDMSRMVKGVTNGAAQIFEVGGDASNPIAEFQVGDYWPKFSDHGRLMIVRHSKTEAQVYSVDDERFISPVIDSGFDIMDLAISADGRRLILSTLFDQSGGIAKVWDCETGAFVSSFSKFGLHVAGILNSSRSVVTPCRLQRSIWFWDYETGVAHGDPIQTDKLLISLPKSDPNERWLAMAMEGGSVGLWDLKTRERLAGPPSHSGAITCLAFSPNGQRLAVGSRARIVTISDCATGDLIGRPMRHRSSVLSLAFAPNGEWVVTGDERGEIRVWEVESGTEISEPIDMRSPVFDLRLRRDGHRIFASAGSALTEWEFQTAPTPIPAWFLSHIEAVVGHRVGNEGHVESLPLAESVASQPPPATDTPANDFYRGLVQDQR